MIEQLFIQKEIKRRTSVALWAYAYEFKSDSLVSDQLFDKTCREINLEISTGNTIMDEWFKKEFTPCTGMWVYRHPNLDKLEEIYTSLKKVQI